jgi:hypothetical protein
VLFTWNVFADRLGLGQTVHLTNFQTRDPTMKELLSDIGETIIGLVLLGVVLLVGNALLWTWHRITKGRRQILALILVCHADDASTWGGRVPSAGEQSMTLNIDDIITRVFSGSKTASAAELVKDRRASRKSFMSIVPSGKRVTSPEDAIGYAVAASRGTLSLSESAKAKALVVQSAASGSRSYIVLIGNFPGNAPRLVAGD